MAEQHGMADSINTSTVSPRRKVTKAIVVREIFIVVWAMFKKIVYKEILVYDKSHLCRRLQQYPELFCNYTRITAETFEYVKVC